VKKKIVLHTWKQVAVAAAVCFLIVWLLITLGDVIVGASIGD
jgi:hypothetical protein